MARRSGLGRVATNMARIAMKQAAAQAREAERQQRVATREYDRNARAWEKQQAQHYLVTRAEQATIQTSDLAAYVSELESVLATAIRLRTFVDLTTFRRTSFIRRLTRPAWIAVHRRRYWRPICQPR